MLTIGATEWALKHGLHRQTVLGLLRRGRIEGARMEGGQWCIPENAPVPQMRVRRAPLVKAPEGMQSVAAWAIEHRVSEKRALTAHRDAGTLTTVEGRHFVPSGPLLAGHVPIAEWATREGLAPAWAVRLARGGKVPGALKISGAWMVPGELTGVRTYAPRKPR